MRCRDTFVALTLAMATIFLLNSTRAAAQTLMTLVSFDGTNGSGPEAPLVQGPDGAFYGTTFGNGFGNLFKITSDGTFTVMYRFCSRHNCSDGSGPNSAMVLGTDSSLYGTTAEGGTHSNGTVFRFNPATGARGTVYNFCSQPNCSDGGVPNGVIQGADGNLYGTTAFTAGGGPGTVFKLTPTGVLTTLHTFCVQPCSDATTPLTGLVQAGDGNLYGTSFNGGVVNAGTVFRITTAGALTTLYNFCVLGINCQDGSQPSALIQAANGDFVGTTQNFGPHNAGTLFKITSSGAFTPLYAFCSQTGCSDGSQSTSGVIQASDGKYYGTTTGGGITSNGTIFQFGAPASLTTLYSFAGTDGRTPTTALLQATDGNFYGTTNAGGTADQGTVFKLSTGLAPFVKPLPTSGHVGASVMILGNGLTGTTSVTFNGTAATFTVLSGTSLRATIPTGATSGTIQVTTPTGVLISNAIFRVRT